MSAARSRSGHPPEEEDVFRSMADAAFIDVGLGDGGGGTRGTDGGNRGGNDVPSMPPSQLPPVGAHDGFLVQFAAGTDGTGIARALAAVQGRALETLRGPGSDHGALLRIEAAGPVEAALSALSHAPGVVFAEPNWTVSVQATSNDTYYTSGSLWGMYGDATTPKNIYGSQAGEAWARGATGSSTIVVGNIDTGIDYRHPDLYLNIWLNQGEIPASLRASLTDSDGDGLITFRDLNNSANAGFVSDLNKNGYIDAGDLLADARWENGIDEDGNGYFDDLIGWDFVNNDNDPYDDNNHGTHTAGTIAAMGGNGAGVAGVAWTAQVMALKFLGANGSGSLDGAIRALDYYTAASIRDQSQGWSSEFIGTNNSWGGGGFSQALLDAIVRAAWQDALFIAAAGNGGSDGKGDNNDRFANYPSNYSTVSGAGYEAVIAVAALTSSGGLASFSNYGVKTVDLGAPGVGVMSTVAGGGYASYSGTSMATPHVTGALALYAGLFPEMTAAELRSVLLSSTTATSSLGSKTVTGGRLDLDRMVGPLTLETAPVVSIASVTRSEGSSGSTPFTFTVSLDKASDTLQTVSWTVGLSTASADDFPAGTPMSGVVEFAAGTTSRTISIDVAGDSVVEADETFTVTLSGASAGLQLGTATATGTIVNDDRSIVSIQALDATKPEGNAGTTPFTFTVALDQAAVTTQTVAWSVSGGTASASDFGSTSGVLTFGPGTSSQLLTVSVPGDTEVEPDEVFTVSLSNPSDGLALGSYWSASGTIENDDAAPAVSGAIMGTAGPDMLVGTTGDDLLVGGAGADTLTGGSGADVFQFAAGDSGQTIGFDVITDYLKGTDVLRYTQALTIGGTSGKATSNEASIHSKTGVATFAAGSGTSLADALADIATRFTRGGDAAGEIALFRLAQAASNDPFYLFISDGTAGVTTNDVVVQLVGVTAVSSIQFSGSDLKIMG